MRCLILFLLFSFFSSAQNAIDLVFENDCTSMYIRLDSNSYELFTNGDGGKNGPIAETGHVVWEKGTAITVGDTLILTSNEPITFNSMIILTLLKVENIEPDNHYFIAKTKGKPDKYWKANGIANQKFNQMIFQGDICK